MKTTADCRHRVQAVCVDTDCWKFFLQRHAVKQTAGRQSAGSLCSPWMLEKKFTGACSQTDYRQTECKQSVFPLDAGKKFYTGLQSSRLQADRVQAVCVHTDCCKNILQGPAVKQIAGRQSAGNLCSPWMLEKKFTGACSQADYRQNRKIAYSPGDCRKKY